MELEVLAKEYLLDCQVRGLSPRTIDLYQKGLGYFFEYLSPQGITKLEDLKPLHIKQYILVLQKKGGKPTYINNLLKPIKCLCAYAFQEDYTDSIISKRVKNVREPNILIHTFSNSKIMGMIKYYDKAYNGRKPWVWTGW